MNWKNPKRLVAIAFAVVGLLILLGSLLLGYMLVCTGLPILILFTVSALLWSGAKKDDLVDQQLKKMLKKAKKKKR